MPSYSKLQKWSNRKNTTYFFQNKKWMSHMHDTFRSKVPHFLAKQTWVYLLTVSQAEQLQSSSEANLKYHTKTWLAGENRDISLEMPWNYEKSCFVCFERAESDMHCSCKSESCYYCITDKWRTTGLFKVVLVYSILHSGCTDLIGKNSFFTLT